MALGRPVAQVLGFQIIQGIRITFLILLAGCKLNGVCS